ncbi:MAG: circadian clock KaiB family protein [Methanomicrobiales archaeon]|nr:circadian clock KaiB family protein [Methanomicrobiales archaeon]MDI6876249.1 circadian clock KaiB family protein [Methanomicrobiales archaeon]
MDRRDEPDPAQPSIADAFDQAVQSRTGTRYILRLYVTGMTPRSRAAIENIKRICEEHLEGCYDLEVIDIYQQPERAREAQVLAAPTLIRQLPLPLRRLIGDMSDTERVLLGLDLRVKE